MFVIGCKGQETKTTGNLIIQKSIRDSFNVKKNLVDTTDAGTEVTEGFSAILFPKRMGDLEEEIIGSEEGFVLPCQCAYKKDTLIIVSALAWEAGFG